MAHQQSLPKGKVKVMWNTIAIKLRNASDRTIGCVPVVNQNQIQVRRSFIQEDPDYNIFASYREDHMCRPVWDLTDEQKAELFDRYFIATEIGPKEAENRLKDILDKNMDTIEKGEGYNFTFPNCIKENMEYNSTVGINLLLKDRTKTRCFRNQHQRYAATTTAATIPKVVENIEWGSRFSKRTIYYSDKDLYGGQERSDAVLTDICCMTGARQDSLHMVPAETGMILGNIVINLKNGYSTSCSIGARIPNPKLIESIEVHEGAGDMRYILLLEKLTMMVYLSNFDYHEDHKCIMISGGGMPSIATRDFLRFLKEHTGLPVYALSDPDPEGAEIMSIYARGSVLSAYDNFNISVPAIRWIGLSSSDLEGLNLPNSSYSLLSNGDLKTLDSISNENLSDEWSYRIDHMRQFNKKTSFEELQKFGTRYLAKTLLPKMIEDAAENKQRGTKAIISEGKKDEDDPSNVGGDDDDESDSNDNKSEDVTDGEEREQRLEKLNKKRSSGSPLNMPARSKKAKVARSPELKSTRGNVHVGTPNLAKKAGKGPVTRTGQKKGPITRSQYKGPITRSKKKAPATSDRSPMS